jgi:hypothetical protein
MLASFVVNGSTDDFIGRNQAGSLISGNGFSCGGRGIHGNLL